MIETFGQEERLMKGTVDDLIDRWLSRIPEAAKAYHQDAYYHSQMVWMRRMLTTMDMAMEDEGVPEVIRQRVVRVVIFGGPDEVQALARMEKAEHPLYLIQPDEVATPEQIRAWVDRRERSELQPTEKDRLKQLNFDAQRDAVNKGKPPAPSSHWTS